VRAGVDGFTEHELTALRYLLYPYQVEVTKETNNLDLMIARDSPFDSSSPLIKVHRRDCRVGTQNDIPLRSYGNGVVELPFDLIRACSIRFHAIVDPRPSPIYLVSTRYFRYNVVPSCIRNLLLRARWHRLSSCLSDHLANEIARRTLIEAFGLVGIVLERKNPPRLLITHDIETEKGLAKAVMLKAVENELEIESIWFVPSEEYPIPRSIARILSDGSTIGSHDVKHDGRLFHIKQHEELVERLKKSRLKLQQVFDKEVDCFRSPLLQFSRGIALALREAGYRSDSSIPSWEPVHPLTMRGFGIESVQAFEIDGVVESPISLYQDHQVFKVLGMNTREAVKLLVEQAMLVRQFDGDIVLLVHPDYSFSLDLHAYRTLLKSLLEVQQVDRSRS